MGLSTTTSLALALGIAAILPAHTSMAFAQNYPTRPVTMVVPFPPGGSTDVVARLLAERMSVSLGQPVVVENRDGASGTVGIGYVASAEPDGYTLGVSGVGSSVLLPAFGREVGYDMQEDFEIIGMMGSLGLVIAGRGTLEAPDLPSLIEYARANPDALTYGTSGAGSPGHLAMELVRSLTGTDMLHVPYRGNAPLVADLMGGHVDLGLLTIPGSTEQLSNGSLRGYGVTSSARSDLLPDVPTVEEGGFDGYAAEIWNILLAPNGTPPEVVERLSEALNAAMDEPAIIEAFQMQAVIPVKMTPQETTDYLAEETAKWSGIIEQSGVTLD